MSDHSFTTDFTVSQTPDAAFAAITNVRGWWSEDIDGHSDKVGAEFTYRFRDIHRCTMKITELVPGKKVAWRVMDNYFNFTKDTSEWTGTDIVFDISRTGDKTEVRLTHHGLVPEYECYAACKDGWSTYIKGSLHDLIATGKGQPNLGEPLTDHERELVL